MINVAIIGCGLIGTKRAESLRALHDADGGDWGRILIFCDADPARAQILADRFGGRVVQDWQETVGSPEIDAVVVSTVNKYLAPIAIDSLRHSKHVLCEKPLGRNVYEARDIVEAARGSGTVLKTGFNHRHHPAVATAKELADRGEIGCIYHIRCRYGHGGRPGYDREWRADRELCGGGELLDQGVHVVDLFRWFMGEFDEAFGYAPTSFWDIVVEDNAFALFKAGESRIASMHTSWTQWKNLFSFEVFGEGGYLVVEGLGGNYGTETLRVGRRRRRLLGGYAAGAPEEQTFTFDGPDISWQAEWREFVSAIRERREPLGSGVDGLEANRMLGAVYEAARRNLPVPIRAQE